MYCVYGNSSWYIHGGLLFGGGPLLGGSVIGGSTVDGDVSHCKGFVYSLCVDLLLLISLVAHVHFQDILSAYWKDSIN